MGERRKRKKEMGGGKKKRSLVSKVGVDIKTRKT